MGGDGRDQRGVALAPVGRISGDEAVVGVDPASGGDGSHGGVVEIVDRHG